MRPTTEQLAGAVSELGSIPFFPTDSGAQLAIMVQLELFVSSAHQLRWLITAAVAGMRKWEGVPELRGLYCTRFKPADGKEVSCRLPGYTAEESEMRITLETSNRPQLAEPAEMVALAKRKAIGGGRYCVECEGSGLRQVTDDHQMSEWCVCPAGARRRAEAPGAVDQANAIVVKLRQRFEPSRKQTEAAEVQAGEQLAKV
jgi:hypothetical protein